MRFHQQDRVSADLEKIVVCPDFIEAENRPPDFQNRPFQFCFRGGKCLRAQAGGIGQCVPVDFSAGRQRQRAQRHQVGGHHEVGKFLREPVAKAGGRDVRQRIGDKIRDQLPCVVVAACDDDGLPDAGVPDEHGFDFTRLDTEAPDFDLMIEPSRELNHAVRAETGKVARAVEAGVRPDAERIGDELFRRETGAVPVAARESVAAEE